MKMKDNSAYLCSDSVSILAPSFYNVFRRVLAVELLTNGVMYSIAKRGGSVASICLSVCLFVCLSAQ